jgi:hypothetical protein
LQPAQGLCFFLDAGLLFQSVFLQQMQAQGETDVPALQAQVKFLCDQQLYDSAELLGSFLICASRSSQSAHAESLAIYADCLVGKAEYRRALVC